jgi:hypothetical protein
MGCILTKKEVLKITLLLDRNKELAATVHNEQFAKMAALPSSENIYYFRGGCS